MRKTAGDALARGAGLVLILCFTGAGDARASLARESESPGRRAVAAQAEYARFIGMISGARTVVLAAKPPAENPRRARPVSAARAGKPVITALTTGAGQAGYVHYFLIRMPDDALEVQVGIELPDHRIAWSFPDLGVVESPFIDAGVVSAGGRDYEVWHLYGIRPFPDDATMAALQKALVDRVRSRIEAGTPYCENDGPRSKCMSCVGFVLRVLFPGRGDYPDLPRDFRRAVTASRYTTHDLLLYITGVLELPTREARLQRIARLTLPEHLREDLEALVYSMGAAEPAAAANAGRLTSSAQERSSASPGKAGVRPAQRGKL